MPAGQGGRQGGGSGSSQGQPRGGSRKREPKGSSHAKPGAPTQKAYVATPADREGTRSITEYFVRRGPLSPRSDGSVFTASEGGTSSRAPSRQGDAPQTSSTSTSTLNADQGHVLSAVHIRPCHAIRPCQALTLKALLMKYEFVTRSIPTLWKGCYLLVARALPPVVFMAQHLHFVPRSSGFLPRTLIRLNSRDKRSKARSWSVEAFRLLCDERDVAPSLC